jgi:hypothetical protein
MTLGAVGLLLTVRAAWGAAAVTGLARTLVVAVAGGAGAGVAGSVVARALPTSGLVSSVGVGMLTAALALALFVGLVAAADRDSGRLLLGRVRRGRA